MNLKPLGDRLIVEPLEEEQTTIGGIVLPDTALEKPQRGNVVAVGPGSARRDRRTHPDRRQPRASRPLSKYGGTEIRIEGTDYLILRESDALAKPSLRIASPPASRQGLE